MAFLIADSAVKNNKNKSTAKAGIETICTTLNTSQRITPVELSHEVLDSDTVRTRYKAGYCHFTVTSKFTGDKPLNDALFEILQQNQ